MIDLQNQTAPVDYWPNFIDDTVEHFHGLTSDVIFHFLDTELPWRRHDTLPREEVYFNDHPVPYTYGKPPHERTYMPEVQWHPWVLLIRTALEAKLDCTLDMCFLNRYLGARDYLGWHADDSPEMDPERPIVTVSLGAERDIEFRRATCHVCGARSKGDHKSICSFAGDPVGAYPVERLTLAHGSVAVMAPGMQQTWQHRVPKSSRSDIGTRISLTFRGYVMRVDPK